MKTPQVVCLTIGFAVLAGAHVGRAGLVNGSFESWNLIGWNVQNDTGSRATEPLIDAAGAARTVDSWGTAWGVNPAMAPVAGYRFLSLNSRVAGDFLGNDTSDIIVSQSFNLNPGAVISGWAYFYNGDSEPLDSAWVRILDQDNNPLTTAWSQTSGAPPLSLAAAVAPASWTQWQWATPTAGNFTLQLGMTTSGANNNASFALYDGITIGAQPIPEPSTVVLGLLSGILLTAARHRRC